MPGHVRPVVVVGDPVLHTPTEPVTEFDAELAALIDDLFATMYVAEGVGLAATQIGVGLAVFVYDCHDDDDVQHKGHLVNPRIIATSGPEQKKDEGCLSVPGPVRDAGAARFRSTVAGQDKHGQPIEVTGTGFLARCLIHETEHLAGHPLHRSPEPATAQPGAAGDRTVPVERSAARPQRRLTLLQNLKVVNAPAACHDLPIGTRQEGRGDGSTGLPHRHGRTASATCGCSARSCRCCRWPAWGLVNATGLAVFWLFGPMFVYLLMPTVDLLLGTRRREPARLGAGLAGAGPVLPLVHLGVPAAAVRQPGVGRLDAEPRRDWIWPTSWR